MILLSPTSFQTKQRLFSLALGKNAFPKYFETSSKFKDMIYEWINFEKKDYCV